MSIDTAAFEGDSKLKTITIKSPVLMEVASGTFKDISPNATFKLSFDKKFKEYIKRILMAAGVAENKIK